MHRLFLSASTGFAQLIHRLVNRFMHPFKQHPADIARMRSPGGETSGGKIRRRRKRTALSRGRR
jgi:hypothetical protein